MGDCDNQARRFWTGEGEAGYSGYHGVEGNLFYRIHGYVCTTNKVKPQLRTRSLSAAR